MIRADLYEQPSDNGTPLGENATAAMTPRTMSRDAIDPAADGWASTRRWTIVSFSPSTGMALSDLLLMVQEEREGQADSSG